MTLLNITETKKFLGIPDSDDTQDVAIQFYISASEKKVEKIIGRVLEEQTVTQKFCGSGEKFFDLDNFPVTMDGITDPLMNGEESLTIDTDFYLEKEEGMIHLDSGVFTKGNNDYVVKYKTGWKGDVVGDDPVEGNVPEDLKLALLTMVSQLWNSNKKNGGRGVKSESFGDYSVTFDDSKISEIDQLLQSYKMPNV